MPEQTNVEKPTGQASDPRTGSVFIDEPRKMMKQRLSEMKAVVKDVEKLVDEGGFIDENHPDYLFKLAYEIMQFCKSSNGAFEQMTHSPND